MKVTITIEGDNIEVNKEKPKLGGIKKKRNKTKVGAVKKLTSAEKKEKKIRSQGEEQEMVKTLDKIVNK